MSFGLMLEDKSSGQVIDGSGGCHDFLSVRYELQEI